MHFGKLVKKIAYSRNLCASELAALMGRNPNEMLFLYEDEEWRSGDIMAASAALNYDFGRYLDKSQHVQFVSSPDDENQIVLLTVRYKKGKETLMQTWINKMLLIAKTIGLEIMR